MTYASICDGIGAAHCAWQPLGWQCKWVSEIEPFPSAVVEHHWKFTNHGDFTKINRGGKAGGPRAEPVRLLAGGTPCQSFSVAGQRGGVDDCRGKLTFEFVELALRLRPEWLVWENVPGVLSIDNGFVFAAFLSALSGRIVRCPESGWSNAGIVESSTSGYGLAWRILDAQFAGVPQRRRRVFVVGYLGEWRRAAAVLFERHSLQGHPPPSRETRQDTTYGIAPCIGASGRGFERTGDTRGQDCVIATHTHTRDSEKPGLVLIPFSIQERAICENPDAGPDGVGIRADGQAFTLEARTVSQAVSRGLSVRRITPRECERLQGMPDDYTLVPYRGKPAADGPRYRAIGNSMAVPVMRWTGDRINAVDALVHNQRGS